ncbi:MAG: hypothetical protein WAV00_03030, partial [Nocardioides sp.]
MTHAPLGGSAARVSRPLLLLALLASVAFFLAPVAPASAVSHAPGDPDLGPNVYVFDPSMPTSDIQATVDAVSAQQVSNQFGTERYAL